MDIQAHTNAVTHRMFVATADQNYMLARLAYFHQLDVDFYWLSLHALEKYLKAVLLLNGQSAKKISHNLIKAHDLVRKIDSRLFFGPLIDPQIKGLHWRDSTVEAFLNRLNQFGNASNRYQTYGYTVMLDDLMKVDQLVWAVRRHCRTFMWTLDTPSGSKTFDEVEILKSNPERWTLGGFLPLEQVIEGKRDQNLREIVLHLNAPFSPEQKHTLQRQRSASSNSPLVEHLERIGLANASLETRALSADVIRWALDHIDFSPKDRREIKDRLDAHDANFASAP